MVNGTRPNWYLVGPHLGPTVPSELVPPHPPVTRRHDIWDVFMCFFDLVVYCFRRFLFFERERDEKIGLIAAEEILNFFLQSVGGKLYNMGIEDAKKALENRVDELKFDLDDLMDY